MVIFFIIKYLIYCGNIIVNIDVIYNVLKLLLFITRMCIYDLMLYNDGNVHVNNYAIQVVSIR